jgi:hypothetical protein
MLNLHSFIESLNLHTPPETPPFARSAPALGETKRTTVSDKNSRQLVISYVHSFLKLQLQHQPYVPTFSTCQGE